MNWGHPDKILRQISSSTAGFDSRLNPDVVKTFSSLIYTNIMIPYLYPLGNWYATYFELALSTKLYVFSCNISNMRCSVSSPDETPRRELKIRRAAEYFWRTSRCFIWWWNTVSNVWYFFSNKIIFEGEIKDANTKQCFIRFPNTH